MWKKDSLLLVMLFPLILQGCASIVSGTTQEITFQANPEDVLVTVNGKVIGKTPTTVQLDKKSGQSVVFSKDGFKPITMQLETTVEPWFWGNIVIGGLFGSTTDGLSGAIVKYSPNQYFVTLQPEGATHIDGLTLKDSREKAKIFILTHFTRLIEDIRQGSGEELSSLVALLEISPEQEEDSLKKIQALSETFTDPPAFADQVLAFYIK